MTGIRGMSTFTAQGGVPSQEDFLIGRQEKGIFVVADGFGGSGCGAAAAKTACESVVGFLEKEAGDLEATLPFVLRSYFSLAGNVLFNALIHANRKVMGLNRGKNVHEKGGASVVAGFLDDDLMALANVGACTAWLIRDGVCGEITVPRTYARLCDPLSEDPAEGLAVPLAALGMGEDLEPEIVEFRVQAGDWLILQTDGVRKPVREALLALHQRGSGVEQIQGVLKRQNWLENASVSVLLF